MTQTSAMPAFDARSYRGLGIWFDRAGGRGNYTTEYIISDEVSALIQTTKRRFLKEDGSLLYQEDSQIRFESTEDPFLRVTIIYGGKEYSGDGYTLDDCLHYELDVSADNHLEGSYFFGRERVTLVGSATNNGNYTVWREMLEAIEPGELSEP
jgi:hypothetical protein